MNNVKQQQKKKNAPIHSRDTTVLAHIQKKIQIQMHSMFFFFEFSEKTHRQNTLEILLHFFVRITHIQNSLSKPAQKMFNKPPGAHIHVIMRQ